jgi:hypothetical protein
VTIQLAGAAPAEEEGARRLAWALHDAFRDGWRSRSDDDGVTITFHRDDGASIFAELLSDRTFGLVTLDAEAATSPGGAPRSQLTVARRDIAFIGSIAAEASLVSGTAAHGLTPHLAQGDRDAGYVPTPWEPEEATPRESL